MKFLFPRFSALCTVLLTATSLPVSAAPPTLTWSTTVDTGASTADRTRAIGMMTNGDVIAASQIGTGSSAQLRVQRLSAASGTAIWTRDVGTASFAEDVADLVVEPATGHAYIAARADTASSGLDWLVFKVNGSDGTLAWGSSYTFSNTGNDEPRAICLTSDGNIAVSGMSTDATSGQSRSRIAKINSSTGASIWSDTSSNDLTDYFDVAADSSGNIFTCGSSGTAAFLAKYSNSGSVTWSQTVSSTGAGNNYWNAITVLSTGDVAVAGSVSVTSQGNNLAVARYASAGGATTWSVNVNGTANLDEAAYDITADASDNPCVAGFLNHTATGLTAYGAKLAAASGAVSWSQTLNGTSAVLLATDAFFSVRILGTDVLFGGTQSGTTTNSDIVITRVNAAGTLQESTTFNGAANNQDTSLTKNLLAVNGTSFAISGDTENATPSTDGITHNYSVGPPPTTITSLNCANATPSSSGTVNWTLTFASAVTGVTSSNFSLSGSATSGASIGTPTTADAGITWNVPVTTDLDGTLTLSFANATGLSLGITTTLPSAGQIYTIDKTRPLVSIGSPSASSIAGGGSVTYAVTYSDANLVSSSLTTGGITLNTTRGASGTIGITGSGTSYTVTLSSVTGSGTIGITVAAATALDGAGNVNLVSAASTTFTVIPAPTVTSISPTAGPSSGGTSVTIYGTNLTGATAVTFGATAATGFTVNSATSITATAPAGSGTVDVRVTTEGGTSATSAADQFTFVAAPTVTSLSPNSGPATGSASVTINGTNLTGATAVTFGATAATGFTVNSATSITATAPAGSGTVDVRVTTEGGTSASSAADQFSYLSATQSIASVALTKNNAATSFTPVVSSGGVAPIRYSISPALPTGLTLSTSTGGITGTPTVTSTATTYTVTVTDNNNVTASNTFSLTVSAVNDAPTLTTVSTLTGATEDTAFTISYATLLAAANAADVDGDTLSFRVEAVSTGSLTKGGLAVEAGTTLLGTGESLVWTPAANANGTLNAFTIKMWDGTTTSAIAIQVQVTVTATNDAPVAIADVHTTTEDTPLVVSLGSPVVDQQQTAWNTALPYNGYQTFTAGHTGFLTSINLFQNGAESNPQQVTLIVYAGDGISGAALGQVTISETNTYNSTLGGYAQTYTFSQPIAIVSGGVYTLSVLSSSSRGTLGSINTNAYANGGFYQSGGYTGDLWFITSVATSQGLLVNDSDAESDSLTAVIVTNSSNGTVALNSDGKFTYTPNANFYGTDTFNYKAYDGTSYSNVATATVNVAAVNDAPTANAQTIAPTEDTTYSDTLTASDIDSSALTYTIVSQGTKGVVTIPNAATGAFTYVPDANANGSDSFTYKANDGSLDSAPAIVTVNIAAVNDAPTLTTVSALTGAPEDTALTISYAALAAAADAADVDGDTLSFRVQAVSAGSLTKGGLAVEAGTTLLGTGESLVWTPAANANGTLNAFTIKAWDGALNSATAIQVQVTVAAVNDAPTLSAIAVSGTKDTTVAFTAANFTGAYSDVESTTLASITVATLPATGLLKLSGTDVTASQVIPAANLGNLTYVPAANENGAKTFTVTASDGTLSSAAATVTMTLAATVTTLAAWGNNSYGQLGDGTTTTRASPVQIGSATSWKSVATGADHTVAVRTDGTLWAWGWNAFGQLGDGTDTDRTSPVQIGLATSWQSVAAGDYHALAVRTDGTLWAWGNNYSGQLGDGTTTTRTSPVQIGSATSWQSVATGQSHSVAVRTDGTLWAWGRNDFGQVGDGTTTDRASPVQIGSATAWQSVATGQSHSVAVRTDGTLWAWGWNAAGQLGDGTATDRTSPVQIGSATSWQSVAAGQSHTVAVRTEGTLWAWGWNDYGQLGDGTATDRTSPVQIGLATSWQSVVAGDYHALAVRTDGTLWAWGRNENGQLGDGTTTGRTSPVQIGSATSWQSVAAGQSHTVAVQAILPALEINLTGNSVSIPDGDSTPSTTDHTDFGSALVTGGTVVRTFTIANNGTASLTLSGTPLVAVSGTHAADFTVTALPTSPVTASGSTTFQVTFDPSGSGTRSATLTLANDVGIYDFAIQGTGVSPFATWQTLNGASGTTAADHDNDGVPDGIEYFVGGPNGNTTGQTTLPSIINNSGTLSITWIKGTGYPGVYGSDYLIETTAALTGTWTPETVGVNVTLIGNNVIYNFPAASGDRRFVRLKVMAP
jgi:VCBS repeat-containing protein